MKNRDQIVQEIEATIRMLDGCLEYLGIEERKGHYWNYERAVLCDLLDWINDDSYEFCLSNSFFQYRDLKKKRGGE